MRPYPTYVDGGWGPNSELDSDNTMGTDLEAAEPSSSPDSQGQQRTTPGVVAPCRHLLQAEEKEKEKVGSLA